MSDQLEQARSTLSTPKVEEGDWEGALAEVFSNDDEIQLCNMLLRQEESFEELGEAHAVPPDDDLAFLKPSPDTVSISASELPWRTYYFEFEGSGNPEKL